MIAVDTNVLLYAHQTDSPFHAAARERLAALAEGEEPWGIPVFCLTEFLRVASHRKVFRKPLDRAAIKLAVERLLEPPGLRILFPGERFMALLLEAIEEGDALGNLVFDAQIVAVCREAGVRALLTEDRDFARFPRFPVVRL